jgi:hypothetical protein
VSYNEEEILISSSVTFFFFNLHTDSARYLLYKMHEQDSSGFCKVCEVLQNLQ